MFSKLQEITKESPQKLRKEASLFVVKQYFVMLPAFVLVLIGLEAKHIAPVVALGSTPDQVADRT